MAAGDIFLTTDTGQDIVIDSPSGGDIFIEAGGLAGGPGKDGVGVPNIGIDGQFLKRVAGQGAWATVTKDDIGLSAVSNDLQLKASNLDTDGTLAGNSDTKIPSQKAVKTYTDAQVATVTTPDADASTKGKVKLANDLGGTAALPTVVATHLTAALPVAQGGTAGTSASAARTNLGLAIGADVQAYNANTTTLGNTTTGSGSVVLATSPTIVTPTIASFANANHNHTNSAGGGQLTDAALSAAVTIAKGGTGQTTASTGFNALSPMTTAGDIIYGGTSGAGTRLAAGSTSQVLIGGTTPSWGAVVLTTMVSGLLPIANGGTGSGTQNFVDLSSVQASIAGAKTFTAAHTISNTSANALAVGPSGATNPAFNVDASTASAVTGLNVLAKAAGSGMTISVISSGTNENVNLIAKGTGTVTIGGGTNGSAIAGVPFTAFSANANCLVAGPNGTTNPTLKVSTNTASAATGLSLTSAAAGSGMALAVISSGTNENLTIDAKGSGTINIGGTSTGAVQVAGVPVVTTTATQTVTNKRNTKRTGTTTSSATPTINTDNVDFYSLTALAVDITSFTTNLSGTPTEAQTLWIAITGTATRAITWGASFEGSTVALPTTTSGTGRLDVGFVWNSVTSKFRCVAVA